MRNKIVFYSTATLWTFAGALLTPVIVPVAGSFYLMRRMLGKTRARHHMVDLWPWWKSYLSQVAWWWSRGMLFLGRALCGVSVCVRGKEHLLAQQGKPVIVACQHRSEWETFLLNALLKSATFVMKESLLNIPIVGWFFRTLEMIPVSRLGKNSERMLAMAQRARAAGRPIVIFPEGTRVKEGRVRYRAGVALLYENLNVPVLPVAVSITFPSRKIIRLQLTFLGAIAPGLSRDALLEHLQSVIEENQP